MDAQPQRRVRKRLVWFSPYLLAVVLFPAFLQTQIPVVDGAGRIDRWMNFSAFALNQDTGGAIRGPGRVDIFWGNGPYAQIAAGHMQHKGSFYLLILDPENI